MDEQTQLLTEIRDLLQQLLDMHHRKQRAGALAFVFCVCAVTVVALVLHFG